MSRAAAIQASIADGAGRELALDPYQSFIVQAPAGSGKTGLLVQRYLRLLSTVKRPESVVAITFTRKAAAEMKSRVEDALRAADDDLAEAGAFGLRTQQLAREALEHSRRNNWHLLADTGRLQIQTIDSLCALLTRQMPVISDVGGTPEVVEDARKLYRQAARRTIRSLAEGDDCDPSLFRKVSLHFENDMGALENHIAEMLSKRDQWQFLAGAAPSDPVVAEFCHLLGRARKALQRVFREQSVVDFAEVTRAAIKSLGTPEEPSDLLFSLDYRIEHLLVDEFQDTSRAQYELLKALTAQWSEGDTHHTLLLVGDPMQSIYRFREAEVGLFLDAWEEQALGAVRLTPIRLVTNFRSTPEIIGWAEETLAPTMPEDDALVGAVKFQPSQAARPLGGVEPTVLPFVDDDGSAEAKQVVEIIQQSSNPGEVAILVRSRSHIVSILPALRLAGIRYEAIEIDELKAQQHILDLLSLTRAVLHVGDRVSWLACLRAPWCGLTLADLSALAEGAGTRPIFDLLSDPERVAALSLDGRQRATRSGEIFSAVLKQVGRVRLRPLVEQLWCALGGPAVLRGPHQREDVYTLLKLIERYEEGGVIRDFSLFEDQLDLLYAEPQTGPGHVRVMTIHQAKGLEFDTVIIPKATSKARSSEDDLLIWTEAQDEHGTTELHLALKPNKSEANLQYETISNEKKIKEANEARRLFYVACTRAKNNLYLLGNVKAKKNRVEPCKASSESFLGMIWPSVEPLFARQARSHALTPAPGRANEAPVPVVTLLRRLPVEWKLPSFERSVQWKANVEAATASERDIPFVWVSDTGRHVGSVVHELLKRIAHDGPDKWTPEKLAQRQPLILSELARLGVAGRAQAAAAATVVRALQNTLSSDRGQWILRTRPEAQVEWPVAGRIGQQVMSGTVDRLFHDEEGRLWIIDYKISEHEGGKPQQFLDKEQSRYRTQLENYGELMSHAGQAGPISLGLYFPLLDGWREWPFKKEASAAAHYTGI